MHASNHRIVRDQASATELSTRAVQVEAARAGGTVAQVHAAHGWRFARRCPEPGILLRKKARPLGSVRSVHRRRLPQWRVRSVRTMTGAATSRWPAGRGVASVSGAVGRMQQVLLVPQACRPPGHATGLAVPAHSRPSAVSDSPSLSRRTDQARAASQPRLVPDGPLMRAALVRRGTASATARSAHRLRPLVTARPPSRSALAARPGPCACRAANHSATRLPTTSADGLVRRHV
jgi:hypothetical protein